MGREDLERIPIASQHALRQWLLEHHSQAESVWLVRYKKHCGDRYVAIPEMVQELLCFGWIDSLKRRVDQDRVANLVSPRKPGSTWSRVNKRNIDKLVAEGRMHPAGLLKIEAAKADGSWTVLDDIEDLVVPPDLRAALDAHPEAEAEWQRWPDSSKKTVLWALASAKRPATRARRLHKYIALAERGERPS
jgi:uncharacterized protein YdeI (YjbR/CyaY-like superfamily)